MYHDPRKYNTWHDKTSNCAILNISYSHKQPNRLFFRVYILTAADVVLYIQNLFILEALATMAFSRSSVDIKLEGSQLKARCKDRAGSYHDSAVELNNYIANIDGLLKWRPNGNFVASSRNVVLAGSVLKCHSKTREGTWRYTSINLDEKISNYNGKLIYKFAHRSLRVRLRASN